MADGESGVSSEPVIAPLPTPISVEPRVAPPAAEAAEIARQVEEAKLPKEATKEAKDEPKKSPATTREALRAAREKVEAEKASPLKTEPKAAEPAKEAAKTEAKAAETPAATKDAKAAEPAKAEPAVTRGEDGKFVSTKPAEPVKAEAPKAAEPAPAVKLPSHTAEAPPARFSAAAKEKWAETSDEVRAETTRAVTELTKGFEKHRAAAERDAGLAEFHEMAAKGNTTVKEALSRYTGMEQLLRSNPDKGLEAIFQNVGISPREWAAKILNQAPDAAASAADANVRRLEAEIAELKKGFTHLHSERETQRTQTTTEAVTKFAADHPRFEELSEDIAFFLKTRTKDLAEAYSLAERLNPAPAKQVEPAPTITPAASEAPSVAVTKPTLVPASSAGQKSIAGAPTAGSDPARKQTSSSIKEALKRARQAVA